MIAEIGHYALVLALGLGWAAPAADGSCEVTGLPTRVLQSIEEPCRPLSEIGACLDSRERR